MQGVIRIEILSRGEQHLSKTYSWSVQCKNLLRTFTVPCISHSHKSIVLQAGGVNIAFGNLQYSIYNNTVLYITVLTALIPYVSISSCILPLRSTALVLWIGRAVETTPSGMLAPPTAPPRLEATVLLERSPVMMSLLVM